MNQCIYGVHQCAEGASVCRGFHHCAEGFTKNMFFGASVCQRCTRVYQCAIIIIYVCNSVPRVCINVPRMHQCAEGTLGRISVPRVHQCAEDCITVPRVLQKICFFGASMCRGCISVPRVASVCRGGASVCGCQQCAVHYFFPIFYIYSYY